MNPITIGESIPLAPFYKWVHIFAFDIKICNETKFYRFSKFYFLKEFKYNNSYWNPYLGQICFTSNWEKYEHISNSGGFCRSNLTIKMCYKH